MNTTLEGRKAILTGGSLGIGAAIARELGRQGASVAINCSRNKMRLLSRSRVTIR